MSYQIVVNQLRQYSIWRLDKPFPAGWSAVGEPGGKDDCLARITELWTDMSPVPGRPSAGEPTDPWPARPETPATIDPGLSAVRGARVPLPDVGVHTLIETRCGHEPDQVAVRYGPDVITRVRLEERTRAWAHVLVRLGAARGQPVAVLLPRSAEAVLAIVAVLRAGTAYLPLSTADPRARLLTILGDAHEPLVITDERGRAGLEGYTGPMVTVTDLDLAAAEAGGRSEPALPTVSAADLAYVMYTSGTTGAPKGVLGTHGQLVNYVRWCAEEFALKPGEPALLHAPLYFVGSVMTLFTALIAGWKLQIAPEPVGFDELARLARSGPCGFLKLTPSHVRGLTALGDVDGMARLIMIGSEPLYLTQEFAAWIAGSPGARFANHYGMSESCGGTWHWIGDDSTLGERLPVGRPILNAEIHIIGPDGERVPVGETGELCMAGQVIGHGYHGQPALTALRWTPHPWGAPGERLLRTGDLARMSPDGIIDVLGRADRQVKIRGHRVALPVVEEALRRCPGVAEAVVSATRAAAGSQRLTAYVRPMPDESLDAAELRARLSEELPEPSVPSRVVPVSRFPLTPNGKVDYAGLAEVPAMRPATAGPFEEPGSELEAALCALFVRVLQVEVVGARDDFFELGGDSLAVVEVVTAAEEDLGVEIGIGEFFDLRTPRRLAESAERAVR